MRKPQTPNLACPPSWAYIASSPSHSSSVYNHANVVPAPTIALPELILNGKTLTFREAKSIISIPLVATTSQIAAAQALLKDIGTLLPLSPQTGNVVQPPPAVVGIGIFPIIDQQIAFSSFSDTKHGLITFVSLTKRPLPPHDVVLGVGKWSYICAGVWFLQPPFSSSPPALDLSRPLDKRHTSPYRCTNLHRFRRRRRRR